MGSSSSTERKITIDNNNPASVIKVSDECVQRIKGYNRGVSISNEAKQQQFVGQQAAFYEPSLTSIQLRQDKLKALKENDNYWDKRVEHLQKSHQEISRVMQQEYDKAVKEVNDANKKSEGHYSGNVPCGPTRAKIIDCYKKNKNEPIRCAKEVQEFSECVDKSTLMIASR